MDEPATFEARAVLAPRRARLSRLALLLPAVLLGAIAWAGLSGPHVKPTTAEVSGPTAAVIAPSLSAEASPKAPSATPGAPARQPSRVFGLDVHRLDQIKAP